MRHDRKPVRPATAACLLVLTAAATLVGCAEPRASVPAPTAGTTCAQLEAERTMAVERRRVALDREHDAWKALVPFAVAARFASGRSAVDEADRQLADLRARASLKGCPNHEG